MTLSLHLVSGVNHHVRRSLQRVGHLSWPSVTRCLLIGCVTCSNIANTILRDGKIFNFKLTVRNDLVSVVSMNERTNELIELNYRICFASMNPEGLDPRLYSEVLARVACVHDMSPSLHPRKRFESRQI